jgi:hypothetical protein
VGASQVGPGSVRGIPHLLRLRAAGFAIWPFEDARPPALLEIWPRALTRAVVKSRRADRIDYLGRQVPELHEPLRSVAARTEDVFDAAVSAAVMARHLDEILELRADSEYALEGRIWAPGAVQPHG